jgi:hypothetical protein
MAMAVAVAAMPVENLGTVSADSTASAWDDDLGKLYGAYTAEMLYKSADYEDKYTDKQPKPIQQIIDGTLADVFEVSYSGDNACITKYVGSSTAVTINSSESYGYARFDKDYVKAFNTAFAGETYNVTYDADVTTITPTTNADGTSSITGSVTVAKIKTDSPTYSIGSSATSINYTNTSTNNDYTSVSTPKNNDDINSIINTAINTYGKKNVSQTVENYNKEIDGYISELKKATTQVEWNTAVDNIKSVINDAGYPDNVKQDDFSISGSNSQITLGIKYSDIDSIVGVKSDNEKGYINDFENYMICKRMTSTTVTPKSLSDGFKLEEIQYSPSSGRASYVYVATDGEYYAVTGSYNIVGIKSNAFRAGVDGVTQLGNVKVDIANTVEFIGSGAFKDQNISSVNLGTGCKIIGDSAFEGCTNLNTFTINGTALTKIGSKAFKNSGLVSIKIPKTVTQIGGNCFEGSYSLSDVTFCDEANSNTTLIIEPFAFYDCKKLKNVLWTERGNENEVRSGTVWIGTAAFALSKPGFDSDDNTAMREFYFPTGNSDIICGDTTNNKYAADPTDKNHADMDELSHDYILAGRSSLDTVIMPSGLLSDIPDHTFAGCELLSTLKFPEDGLGRASFDPLTLFKSIVNPDFCVYGPMYKNKADSSGNATQRSLTWTAENANGDPVPYCYEKDGRVYCEYGVIDNATNTAPFIATVFSDKGDEDNATLYKYTVNSEVTGNENLKKQAIKIGKVGKFTVTTVGDGTNSIFPTDNQYENKNMADKVYKVEMDDSVKTISANAFKNSEIEWVFIGSGVESIGDQAFYNCKSLENVSFACDSSMYGSNVSESAWDNLPLQSIAESAFDTGSKYLTFHGPANSNYLPFQYAMREGTYAGKSKPGSTALSSSDTTRKLTQANEICYKVDILDDSDYGSYIILKDSSTGLATLVDYPHYEDLSKADQDAFIEYLKKINKDDEAESSEESEEETPEDVTDEVTSAGGVISIQDDKIPLTDNATDTTISTQADQVSVLDDVNQILNIYVPDGVESIKTVDFFKDTDASSNGGNFPYLYLRYQEKKQIKDGGDVGKNVEDVSNGDVVIGGYYDRTTHDGNDKLLDRAINGDLGKNDVQQLYYSGNYYTKAQNEDEIFVPGLFSGRFKEADIYLLKNNKFYGKRGTYVSESIEGGNDILTTISLPTVTSLPDNAFYSCENLVEATLNGDATTLGALPFKGAKSMFVANFTNNSQYSSVNQLLFKTSDGKKELLECFESRGNGEKYEGNDEYYGSKDVTADELAGVTSLAKGAFSDCENITSVDLSKSTISEVTMSAFEDCTDLEEVTLPSTIISINSKAFNNTYRKLKIKFEGTPNVAIDNYAFDGNNTVIFQGAKYDGDEYSMVYKSFMQLKEYFNDEKRGTVDTDPDYDTDGDKFLFYDAGSEYLIEFLDEDYSPLSSTDPTYGVITVNTSERDYLVDDQIPTAPAKNGYTFKRWIYYNPDTKTTYKSDDEADENGRKAIFSNIKENRQIIAVYEPDESVVVGDGNYYQLNVVNGFAIINGQQVTQFPVSVAGGTKDITLVATPDTTLGESVASFRTWDSNPAVSNSLFNNKANYITNFTMPNSDETLTAVFGSTSSAGSSGNDNNQSGSGNNGGTNTDGSGSGNNNGSTSNGSTNGSTSSSTDSTTKYTVTVNYGSGSGSYAAGDIVSISAYAPTSSSRVFSKWSSSNSAVGFADSTGATTSFVMPASDVTVTANYKARSDDDDDDDDDTTSKRPGSSTTTTTVSSTPNSSSSTATTTSTVSSTGSDNGNRIYITKNGVSNTDLASVNITGSTDNFVVKISESDEANEMAKQALTNTYGSLDGIQYFPMDISLYDSTGQNKITDTYGLNVTVTMPIPDVLIQYGGNARVATTDNGVLTQITPKFTTIDGIACISFVPPHFSPYVIYVDTNNLIAGQMYDTTPKTGDPIHPKWFASLGMAGVSVLLFATSDGRKRKKYKTA